MIYEKMPAMHLACFQQKKTMDKACSYVNVYRASNGEIWAQATDQHILVRIKMPDNWQEMELNGRGILIHRLLWKDVIMKDKMNVPAKIVIGNVVIGTAIGPVSIAHECANTFKIDEQPFPGVDALMPKTFNDDEVDQIAFDPILLSAAYSIIKDKYSMGCYFGFSGPDKPIRLLPINTGDYHENPNYGLVMPLQIGKKLFERWGKKID